MVNATKKDFFLQEEEISGEIFNTWLNKCGISRTLALDEINQSSKLCEKIGMKTFQQWTSANESAKKISAKQEEESGNRVVAIVEWFFNEHLHRKNGFMLTTELAKIIEIYRDIPVTNRLQLNRILHDLKIANNEIETKLPINSDWRKQLCEEPVCAFVMDKYWCLRATTHYELGFAGYTESDLKNWGCWQRLNSSMGGIPKHLQNSPMSKTRGPYAQEYYIKQMIRFRFSISDLLSREDERLDTIMELLNEIPDFNKIWDLSIQQEHEHLSNSFGFPVPFFRKDGTLLWMMEFSTPISNTDGFQLISWTPINRDSSIYLADLTKSIDESGEFSKQCFFVEDYAEYFTEKQCKALGIPSRNS